VQCRVAERGRWPTATARFPTGSGAACNAALPGTGATAGGCGRAWLSGAGRHRGLLRVEDRPANILGSEHGTEGLRQGKLQGAAVVRGTHGIPSSICLGKSIFIVAVTAPPCQHMLGQMAEAEEARVPGQARYLDIAASLRARIEAGEWAPGSNLPRMQDLAAEYRANRDTIARAVAKLEGAGLVWAVPRRGTVVRYGLTRPRRTRGNIVKRNIATGSPGYSFPAASGTEVWGHHIPPSATIEALADPRIARMLGVPQGSPVLRRFRVTGPVTEPPFEICISWIHPRGVEDAPEVAQQEPGPGGWLYRLEKAGHGPIEWMEIHRTRLPSSEEAALLQIPVVLPILEIARVGRSARDGKPIEVTIYVIPGDRVETAIVLERDQSAQWPWPDEPEA
jgi:DNA-binding GntR family transcriptional regulator